MNKSSVAWIPTKDNNLTMIGVYSIGGIIIKSNLSDSRAESIAFELSQSFGGTSGHYIPIYS